MSMYNNLRQSFVADWIRRIFRVTIISPENEPDSTGILVCANHTSNWDPIIMGACMRKTLRYMAKKELFMVPLLGWLIKKLGAYPVDRKNSDIAAIKNTIRILKDGENVGMYPQGKRFPGRSPVGTPVKSGAAMIAGKVKCGVLPVSIMTKKNKTGLFKRTTLIVGQFIPYEELFPDGKDANAASATELIFSRICKPFEEPERYVD